MGIDLEAGKFEYRKDHNGNLLKFPKGMSEDEILQAVRKRDPDYSRYEKEIINNDLYQIPDMNVPSFKEYKNYLNRPPEPERTMGDRIKGVGETIIKPITAVGSAALSPIIYGAETAKDYMTNQPIESFGDVFPKIMGAGTYQAKTEAGKEYLDNVGDAWRDSKLDGLMGLTSPVRGMPMLLNIANKANKAAKVTKAPKFKNPDKSALSDFFGMTTGAGGQPLKQAYEVAKRGTKKQIKSFDDAIRGNVNAQQTVGKAQAALRKIREMISKEYQANKAKLTKDKSVLDFKDIDEALIKIKQSGKFESETIKKSTVKIQKEITEIVKNWKKLDPKKYHTPEGIDALKQKIGDLYDSTQPFTAERGVVQEVYRSVGSTIRKNAPIYDDMMSGYEEGKAIIREIEDTFSMGQRGGRPKAIDTQFRKLQSVMKDNVNANFGERFNLSKRLAELDPTLFPELSGQALTSYMPTGIQRLVGGANVADAVWDMFSGGGIPFKNLALAPIQSPRIMGNVSRFAGDISRRAGNINTAPLTNAINKAIIDPSKGLLDASKEIGRYPASYSLIPSVEDEKR